METIESTQLEQLAGQLFDRYAEARRAECILLPEVVLHSRDAAVLAAGFLALETGKTYGAAIYDEEMQRRGIYANLAGHSQRIRSGIFRVSMYRIGREINKADTLEEALQILVND